MQKIYIAGCGGMLGEAFYHYFSEHYALKCTDIDVNADWLSYCDVRRAEDYRRDVTAFGPDILFHLAALTDLEYCENHPDHAYVTNTLGVENAVYIANDLDIPLLYISTAGIFDGRQEFYDDWDQPRPMGHYARSKFFGEQFVRESVRRHLICRAGWMMGGGPAKDKKFVNKIYRQICAGRKVLNVVDDKFGTPTYTHDFARTVGELIQRGYYGLYNVVCQGDTSRLELARHMVNHLGLGERIGINAVSSDFFKKEYFAPRPASERLLNRKLELRGINLMQDWRNRLELYLDTYFPPPFSAG